MSDTRAFPMFRQQAQQQQKTGPAGQPDADAAAATAAAEAAASSEAPGASAQAAADAKVTRTPEEELAFWKSQSRTWEERAKANFPAAKELAEIKAATATDLEKAVAAAKAEGRAEVTSTVANQLIDSKVEALAAKAGFIDAADAIAHLPKTVRSLAVKEDGTLDANLLNEAIAEVAEKKPYLVGSFKPQPDRAQGARQTSTAGPTPEAMKASMERALGRKPAKA